MTVPLCKCFVLHIFCAELPECWSDPDDAARSDPRTHADIVHH
jgi:hypothetical protein